MRAGREEGERDAARLGYIKKKSDLVRQGVEADFWRLTEAALTYPSEKSALPQAKTVLSREVIRDKHRSYSWAAWPCLCGGRQQRPVKACKVMMTKVSGYGGSTHAILPKPGAGSNTSEDMMAVLCDQDGPDRPGGAGTSCGGGDISDDVA